MARKLRIEYPGAIYHVMNRGDRQEATFHDDQDRELSVATLAEACGKADWQVHPFCLMGNHFHLVVETPRGNLVAGMKWFLGTCTARFNRRHRVFGHLFSGRYKSLVVDAASPGYLRTVCEYVHLNPVPAELLRPADRCGRIGGAVTRRFWGGRSGGRRGCGWNGCWGRWEFPRTARPDAGGSSG